MKKNIKYVCVLITLTLFMFVSCSGNLTDTLLKVMDSTNTNVFEQAGLVKPDTSAADNALKAMNSSKVEITKENDGSVDITKKDEFKAISDAGITFTLTGDLATAAAHGVLAPQTAEQKASFAAAINSTNEASQKAMEEKLTKEISGDDKKLVQGTMAVASGAITSAASKIEDKSSDVYKLLNGLAGQLEKTATDSNAVITEADKVQAQLLTNIAVSAAIASEDLQGKNPLESPKVKELVNDTLTLYKAAKIASGSVDILQTEGLFDLFTNQKEGSKGIVEINAEKKYVDLVINLIKNGLGKDPDKYSSKYNSYKCMVDARNLTFAIVNQKVEDPTIKASATTGSVIELLNAALFANLLDPGFTIPLNNSDNVSFRTILMDIVNSSPDLFTKGVIQSNNYSDALTKLFKSDPTVSGTDFNTKGIEILTNLLPTAKTADNMMTVGGFEIEELLKALNISGNTGITTISQWLEELIEKMSKTN